MSAIHEITRDRAIRKYHTKIKVMVHSHGKDKGVDISSDVAAVNLGKTLKGTGQANLTLVPSRNFLNYMGPNDYINIYFARADGYGWTRAFFGLIDRIEESYAVDSTGKPTTTYSLMCSDFAKVFDKSQYYINAAIMNRDDVFASDIGNSTASVALYSSGMMINGTPSDIVTQILITLLGFSGQFTIPESYGKEVSSSALITENNMLRTQMAETYLPASARARLPVGGLFKLANDAFNETRLKALRDQIESDTLPTDQIAALSQQYGVDPENLRSAIGGSDAVFRDVASKELIKKTLMDLPGVDASYAGSGQVANRLVSSALPGVPRNMLNLINIGTFIERRGIAGFTHGLSITDANTAIISLLRSHANEIVNEMFFDLRPLNSENGGFAVGASWSTEADEISGNVASNGVANGVRYVPAMIMREYPFSTIDHVDGSKSPLHLNDDSGNPIKYQKFEFGAIFSDKPNSPGRHIVEIKNLNIRDKNTNFKHYKKTKCQKHLDVAVIHSSEITKSSFGRSDTDVVNLLELTTDANQGTASNRYMINLLPIITPISMMHHGLRVKRDSTRYARANAPFVPQTNTPGSPGGPSAGSGQQGPLPPPSPGGLYPPVRVTPEQLAYTNRRPGEERTKPILAANPKDTRRWGFMRTCPPELSRGEVGTQIRLHAGVDIYGESCWIDRDGTKHTGTKVLAAMDGKVHEIFHNGDQDIYGNQIILEHPGRGENGTSLYTCYQHLGTSKYYGNGKDNPHYIEGDPAHSTGILVSKGNTVRMGQHIGYLGYSAGERNPSVRWRKEKGLQGGANGRDSGHLHFEIRRVEGIPKCHFPLAMKRNLPPWSPLSQLSAADQAKIKTHDPVAFYEANGMSLFEVLDARNPVPEAAGAASAAASAATAANQAAMLAANSAAGVNEAGELLMTPQQPPVDPNTYITPGVDQDTSVDPSVPVDDTEPESSEDPSAPSEPDDGDVGNDNSATNGISDDDDPTPPEQPARRVDSGTPPQETVPKANNDEGLDGETVQNLLGRWALLQDHWYQHNHEYVSGTIEMRGAPEIRVGYRLDIIDRNMSFYVESVNHTWTYAGAMMTTLKVTRGQPNNPYPAYIHTRTKGLGKDVTQRYNNSRLSKYFIIPDPITLQRAKVFRREATDYLPVRSSAINELDLDSTLSKRKEMETYIISGAADLANSSETPDQRNAAIDSTLDADRAAAALEDATVESPVENAEGTITGVTPPDNTRTETP